MDSNIPTGLDALFAEARREPLVMLRTEIAPLLDRQMPDADRFDQLSINRQGTKIMYTFLVAAALIGAGSLAGIFGGTNTTKLSGAALSATVLAANVASVNVSSAMPHPAAQEARSTSSSVASVATVALQRNGAPSRYHQSGVSFRTGRIPNTQDHDAQKPFVSNPVDISGIGSIVLTNEELAGLGVQVDTAGVWIFHSSLDLSALDSLASQHGAFELDVNEDPNNPAINARPVENQRAAVMEGTVAAYQVSMYGTVIPPDPEQVRKPSTHVTTLFPTLVTDDLGAWRMYAGDDAALEGEIKAMVQTAMSNHGATAVDAFHSVMEKIDSGTSAAIKTSRLIPILVRTGHAYTAADSAAHHWRPDCIFWYSATPEFLSAIPARLRATLERELRAADRLDQKPSNIPVEEFISREPVETRRLLESYVSGPSLGTPGVPSVDAFRGASGAILSTLVIPNPATDRASVRYTLQSSRTVTVSLHEINGGHIRDLVGARPCPAGEYEESIDLSDLPAGIYLVSITTEKGERGIQRLIVRQ